MKLLIPYEDYRRIFNTIYSILRSVKADLSHCCVPFSLIGAAILHKHHKINAKVYVGLAAYMVDDTDGTVLVFAEKVGDQPVSTDTGFHAWIEAEGYVIDFLSPLFPELIKDGSGRSLCPPKMFQKQINRMAEMPGELSSNGDFFLRASQQLTTEMIDMFCDSPANMDLLNICCTWYQRLPQKMMDVLPIMDSVDGIKNIPFQRLPFSGSW